MPQTWHVGEAFKNKLMRLVLEGVILLVHQQAQLPVACAREELPSVLSTRGRPLDAPEAGGISRHALAVPTVVNPEVVRGPPIALRHPSLFGQSLARPQARVQSDSEVRTGLEVSEHPSELEVAECLPRRSIRAFRAL